MNLPAPITDTLDPRVLKAARLARASGQWIKIRSKDGRPLAFGIPSSKGDGHYYTVNTRQCSCPDFRFGDGQLCKHVLAVRMHIEQVRSQRQAKLAARYDACVRLMEA